MKHRGESILATGVGAATTRTTAEIMAGTRVAGYAVLRVVHSHREGYEHGFRVKMAFEFLW